VTVNVVAPKGVFRLPFAAFKATSGSLSGPPREIDPSQQKGECDDSP
jgi:hypothetical protein